MVLDRFKLDGKTAIVTGASAGLGEGMAKALAEAGADVVCVARRQSKGAVDYITSIGRKAISIQADLVSQKPIPEIIETAVKEFGHVDILVNNAGITRRDDAIDFTEKDWDDVININLKSLFFLSQAFAKQIIKQGTGGKIINTASMLSYQGGVRVPSYTASKSGVLGLTKLLANEFAKYGINVNAVAPGYMDTDIISGLCSDPVRSEEKLKNIPLGRFGTPEDVAGAVVFLASEAASYVQGFTVAVDGGWLAR